MTFMLPIAFRPRTRSLYRFSLLLALALTSVTWFVSPAPAAPVADLWPRWQQHDPGNTAAIDHTSWNTFLQAYVIASHPSGINRVRYSTVTPADRQALQRYVDTLQALPISTYNRNQQQAFWINLYNAFTLLVVLKDYPVDTIRDIDRSSGLFGSLFSEGPWDAKLLTVEGEKVSLNDIEHRILRPIWKDNRIHYAVNCASLGCPNLAPVAYTAANLDTQLTQGAEAYVNHQRGATFTGGTLTVSSIYEWFQDDFGGNPAGVVQHLRRYARGELAKRLTEFDGRLKDHYDWRLNAPEVVYSGPS